MLLTRFPDCIALFGSHSCIRACIRARAFLKDKYKGLYDRKVFLRKVGAEESILTLNRENSTVIVKTACEDNLESEMSGEGRSGTIGRMIHDPLPQKRVLTWRSVHHLSIILQIYLVSQGILAQRVRTNGWLVIPMVTEVLFEEMLL